MKRLTQITVLAAIAALPFATALALTPPVESETVTKADRANDHERCVVSGDRDPADFADTQEAALEDFAHDHSLVGEQLRDFEVMADEAVRDAASALIDTARGQIIAGPLRLLEAGRTIAQVEVVEFDGGWAVTSYEIEVPAAVCETLAGRRSQPRN